MYPSLYYAFKDLFGIDLPFLKMIQMFGFFVAVAFIIAAYFWTRELKRKEKEGLIQPTSHKVLKGQKATTSELVSSGLIGFILGFKLLYIAFNFNSFLDDTQGFILSARGNLLGGILFAAGFAYLKYREKEKTRLTTPVWKDELVHPYQQVGNLTLIAALAGIIGAKIFHNLENWNDFIADPVDALVSFSGLTMYGGLILASIACIWYGRKNGIKVTHLIDSAAPSLMLGYAVGRIGCHLSGDGDWGILNSAYVSDPAGKAIPAVGDQFQAALENNQPFFVNQFGSLENVSHLSFLKPSFLPDWMVAYTYPHNVVKEGVAIPGCVGQFCNHLPIPVFPTAFYETIMCLILFAVLWSIRKRVTTPGVLFSVYLIFNGIERFFIEKIRVNTLYHVGNFGFTQAELISTILFFTGIFGVWYFKKREKINSEKTEKILTN
jgi:phosphatidylglycerol---prolipoprotein diacylglyceryl transferase